jgi:hypothetical protein
MNSAQLRVAIAVFALTVVPISGLAPRANAADVETIALTCPKGEVPHGASCVKKTVSSTIPKVTYVNGRQVVVPNKARTSHLPKGSYGKYCTDSSMQGKYLTSHCESTNNGGTFSTITSIDPSTCDGRHIIAKAGLLQCAPAPSASKSPAP